MKEKWKKLQVCVGVDKYMVSDCGRIKKCSRKSIALRCPDTKEKILSGSLTQKGYKRILLKIGQRKKRFYIHRLVALVFVPNPDNKPHVNHKDGNKLNNHYSNLEWCTPQENNEHGFLMGLLKRGRKPIARKSKRTEWGSYRPILDLHTGVFYKTYELVNVFNKPEKYVCRIVSGNRRKQKRYIYT